jgi:diaminopimelate epimerase
MNITFYKYQGTGNDFIIIDDRDSSFPRKNHDLVAQLCDRKFGIGADGLMLLKNSDSHNFEMVYFNADGHEGSMCGNGGRSIVQFAFDQNIIGVTTTFMAVDGEHDATVSDVVSLGMGDVENITTQENALYMDTGSPHHVEFVENIVDFDIVGNGARIRNSDLYAPNGTNVNFVEKIGDNAIFVRTFERGVEDETLSCGTGVTACAISSVINGMTSPIQVKTLGGNLSVSFDKIGDTYSNIHLIGPAQFVFKGEIDVK